jgi:hypothetical protein
VGSLKALDPNRPIREADMTYRFSTLFRFCHLNRLLSEPPIELAYS